MQEIWNVTFSVLKLKQITQNQFCKATAEIIDIIIAIKQTYFSLTLQGKVSITTENNMYLGRINESISDTLRFCLFI